MRERLGAVTTREVKTVLQRAGFSVVRSTDTHFFLRKPGTRTVCVPGNPGHTLPPGTLGRILRQAGMTADEFKQWREGTAK